MHDCTRCRHAIDVRCPYSRRTATHHRVIDCVVPMYGGMATQLASWRHASAAATSNAADAAATADSLSMCLVGQSDVMYAYARAVLPPTRGLFYLAADNASFTSQPQCASLRVPPPQRWRVHEEPDHEHLCTGASVALTCRVLHPGEASKELHHDVREMMRRAETPVTTPGAADAISRDGLAASPLESRHEPIALLISRNRSSARGRAFSVEDEAALLRRIGGNGTNGNGKLPHLRPVMYSGAENVSETISLFARAEVVVGIHGAGLTNTIFTPHRVRARLHLNRRHVATAAVTEHHYVHPVPRGRCASLRSQPSRTAHIMSNGAQVASIPGVRTARCLAGLAR